MGKSRSLWLGAGWGRGVGLLLFSALAWLGLITCGGGGGEPGPSLVVSTKTVSWTPSPTEPPPTAQVQITHTGPNELEGLAVAIEYQTGTGWLAATLSSTTTPSTLTLTATPPATAGSYTATVTVSATGVTPQTVTVHLTIGVGPGVPVAPSNLRATAVSATEIDLSWTDNSSNEEGFRIETLYNTAPYQTWGEIGTVPAGVTTYHHTGLSPSTTHTYRVGAYNSAGTSYSDQATATTQGPQQITVYASADNDLIYSTTNAGAANTVWPSGVISVGCEYAVGWITDWVCSDIALQFNGLQAQIAGRPIASAVLRLYPSDLAADFNTTYRVDAFTASWSPSSITWNNGPNYYLSYEASHAPPTTYDPLDFAITGIVQQWANGSWGNYGLLVRSDFLIPSLSLIQYTDFESSDYYSSPERRPQITVTFQ